MIVSKLDPAQAVSLWDNFEPGVQEIHLLSQGTFGWDPADVLRALRDKSAIACFVYDGEERVAWMIYRYLLESSARRPYLHVWLAWKDPRQRGKALGIEAFCAEWLGKEAKKNRCRYVEMDSNRVGWMKAGPRIGFKPHRIVFRMEV